MTTDSFYSPSAVLVRHQAEVARELPSATAEQRQMVGREVVITMLAAPLHPDLVGPLTVEDTETYVDGDDGPIRHRVLVAGQWLPASAVQLTAK